ncbi:LamG-like jellyroll fold domain-containing protein [Actinomadura sp. K4S16]|uniref:LamG-like jellyroll fold domain-containing protein n=1 Tax=Actinomadura sp. K4S16 TaxID=1316147 RepID=UPI0011EDF52B|nr:LamG-like jellyroll fold domain-containing protein [Actinomadura sp. K4S16]
MLRSLRRSATARRTAILMCVALVLMATEQPALASEGMPEVSFAGVSGMFGWLTGEPVPHWGRLPKQKSGTAAGRSHSAPAATTRAGSGAGRKPGHGKGELPAFKPGSRRVPKGRSGHGQVGFAESTSRRVASKSTATTDYYRNADGSHTRKLAQGPINYRDGSGGWQPIDTTVRKGDDQRWHERANSLGVSFAPRASDGRLAQVDGGDGGRLAYALQGAASVTPTVSGSVVTYSGVLPATDLSMWPTATGLKESIVLRSADAGNVWVFPLKLRGLKLRKAADGSIELVDGSGKTAGRIPAGYAFDSKIDKRSGEGASTHAVTYELTEVDGKPALTVRLDEKWLHAPERVFPVTVDPSYNNLFTWSTTYAESGIDPGDHSVEETIKVGSWDAGPHSANSFLKFPRAGIDGSQVTVSAAQLRLFDTWAATCTAERFDVAAVTEDWSPSKVVSYPGPSHGGSIGSTTPNVPHACANTGADRTVGDEVTVNLSTATFNNWAGGGDDYGLALYASTSDSLHWKQFNTAFAPTGTPVLFLTYTGAMLPQVYGQIPPSGHHAHTLTPQLTTWGARDPNLPVTIKYRFQVLDTESNAVADSGLISASATSSTVTWQVPSGKLKWGHTYYWGAVAYDGTNYSPAPTLNQLVVSVPQPAITSSLAQNNDHDFDPAIGNYTSTATDANVTTVGPSLAVVRDYNSRDTRTSGGFGTGWSSVFDAKATERYTTSGAVRSVAVAYPNGATVGFGKNPDGSFSPPSGRFATFTAITGGYRLTDKNDTVYTFGQALGSGGYGITSVADAAGRTVTFTWASGHVTTMTSSASGRSLHLTWSTPTGATAPHVATVATDPSTPGDASTAQTWTYSYTADRLSSVCSPEDTAPDCTRYGYQTASPHREQVLDQGASSYWPLAETSGTTAASAVLVNEGTDNGTYSNVTLGQPGPLTGSTATAAGFNGTSSKVGLPDLHMGVSTTESVSMWFKTSQGPGVLLSYSDKEIKASNTQGNFTPALYIGTDGKLKGTFWWDGESPNPLSTSGSVADGAWHHVVLSGSPTEQTMWLDGAKVATGAGATSYDFNYQPTSFRHHYLGTGYLGWKWPDQPHYSTSSYTVYGTYFNGSMSDVALFGEPLVKADVEALYHSGTKPTSLLNSITKPSGDSHATVSYDPLTSTVTHVTDENGGSWNVAAPTVTGSSQVYRAAVLGSQPASYYRFGEAAGAARAIGEINSTPAEYSNVTLGADGPFDDATAAAFDGTTSIVRLPLDDQVQTSPGSIEMWFKVPVGSTAGGVLFDEESEPVGPVAGNYVPALYIGTDGKVHGKFWDTDGTTEVLASGQKVNDGVWHHVALAAGTNAQTLYLDGVAQGSLSAPLATTGVNYVYVGAGISGGHWPSHPVDTTGYFTGSIADFAFYHSQLSGEDVVRHYAAGRNSRGLAPTTTFNLTDPGGKTLVYQYDPAYGNRAISQTDEYGHRTTFGYDSGGYLHTVTDPNGNVKTTGHDVRGNPVSETTCQDQAAHKCSTTYTTYLPDDTSTQLTPDPKNDLVATIRDGRSSGPSDDTYKTSYTYDDAGNRTSVTTPPVAGFPDGRTTTISYTDGTTVAAADSGFAPAGLPYKTVSPGGATNTIGYFHTGDVASVTDAAGKITSFTYDGLGRILTTTEVSDTYPDGLTASYTYNKLGQVLTQTDPPVTNRVTGAVHTRKTTSVYNANGDVTSTTVSDLTGGDASRTASTAYNTHGQVTSQTDPLNRVTEFTYDAYGNKATEKSPRGITTAYTYNADGQQLTQTLKNYTGDPNDPQDAHDLVESSRAYDPAGRLASLTDSMGNTTSYTYADNGLVATVTRTDSSGADPFVERSTTYDAAGNPVQQVTNNGATVTTQTMDAADRITSTTVDPSGVARRQTISYTPDDQVESTTDEAPGEWPASTSYTYDPLGRMTSETLKADDPGHPVGWWKLDQTSGAMVTDSSGTGNAAHASEVTWNDDAAVFGGATGQEIATNGPVIDASQSFSVSAWVDLAATGGTGLQTAVSQDDTSASGFRLQYDAANDRWAFAMQGAASSALSSAAPSAGTWAHLVGVFDSGTGAMTLYVDGTAQGTSTTSAPVAASGPLAIGRAQLNGAAADLFKGSISNVQIYNRALSAGDVSTLYGKGRTGGTVASWTTAVTKYKLDTRGLPTSMVDPNGQSTHFTYDEAGRQVVVTAPTVNTETGGGTPVAAHPVSMIGYDTFGARTETQDPDGNVTTIAYDAAGQQTGTTLPGYTPPGETNEITAVTTRAYDDDGNVTDVTDPLGKITHLAYNQLGDVSTVTDASDGVAKAVHDTNGEVLSTTSPTGAQTQFTYDHLGRKLTETTLERRPSPVAATTTYSYTASSDNPSGAFLASETTPEGATTQYRYDNVGEVEAVTDPAGNQTRYGYDLYGRKVKMTNPDGTSTIWRLTRYGDPKRVIQRDTDGSTTLTSTAATYDAMGRLWSATDANGHKTRFIRDSLGRITSEVQPVDDTRSITTSFGYDAAGNRTRYTDGRGNSWIYGYNTWNKPESVLEPATATYTTTNDRTSTVAYDAAGRPVRNTLPGGVTVTTGYDDVGRVTSQSGTGADAPTADRTFTYDHDGRMLTAATSAAGSAPATSETFTYNDRGQLLTASGSAGAGSFAYNDDGLPTSRTDAAGTTTYTYDVADRLSTLADPATGTTLTYGYDDMSQLTSIAYGTGGNTRAYTYDHLHRLTGDTLKKPDGTAIASITYGYDDNGNETSKTTTGFGGTVQNTYAYDWANRLTSWDNGTTVTPYEYDDSGNRTRVGADVYTYDARDQLTSDGTNSYTYTARGTLSTQTTPTQTLTATSDAYGQQATVAAPAGTQTYITDALGRVVTAESTATPSRNFSYTGTGNTLASDGTNTYTRTPDDALVGIGTPAGGNGVLAYLDQHDDVVGNFTSSGTALTGSTTYDPLGNATNSTTMSGRLGYQSGWTDDTTGKVNMAARWYNPAVGQFQNKDTVVLDPVPDPNQANPFAYVGGNPLLGTDPTGHCWGGFGLVCKAASAINRHVIQPVWHHIQSGYDKVRQGLSWVNRHVRSAVSAAARAFEHQLQVWTQEIRDAYRQIRQQEIRWKAAAKRAAARARKAAAAAKARAINKFNEAYNLGKYAVSRMQKAVHTTATFVQHHGAAIASIALSTVTFIGCEAALGAATGGVGAVVGAAGCGMLAGMVGGAIDQGAKCMKGQEGACSAESFGKTMLIGGIGGAVGGAIGGSLGGRLAQSALGKILPRLATDALEGAAVGGLSGGATGGIDYGLTCHERSGGCSWSGAAGAATKGAAVGAIGGAAGGAIGGRLFRGKCHSFTAPTPVLLADGSAKPISKIRAGDKVLASVPGGRNEAHTVQRVIVTRTDHEFVDLTIAAGHPGRGPPAKLTTTGTHPFYDITQSAFVDAAHIKPGDKLQQPDGTTATVTKTRHYTATQVTYDLTINNLHTYYVQAGTTPVLVHNCEGETLDRAIALHQTRANPESTVGVAKVRPSGQPNAPPETWVATERFGLPREWDPKAGGSSPLSPSERYISGPGHAEETLAREMRLNGYEPVEVGSSTNMCFECFYGLQGSPFNLVKSDIGARNSNRINHSQYRLMVRREGR